MPPMTMRRPPKIRTDHLRRGKRFGLERTGATVDRDVLSMDMDEEILDADADANWLSNVVPIIVKLLAKKSGSSQSTSSLTIDIVNKESKRLMNRMISIGAEDQRRPVSSPNNLGKKKFNGRIDGVWSFQQRDVPSYAPKWKIAQKRYASTWKKQTFSVLDAIILSAFAIYKWRESFLLQYKWEKKLSLSPLFLSPLMSCNTLN